MVLTLLSLPDDAIFHIFTFCDNETKLNLILASRRTAAFFYHSYYFGRFVALKEAQVQESIAKTDAVLAELDMDALNQVNEQAQRAIYVLDANSIAELKQLRQPPPAVRFVIEMMHRVLTGDSRVTFEEAYKELRRPSLLHDLIKFRPEHMTKSVYAVLDKFCRNCDFTPDAVTQSSRAAGTITRWLYALYRAFTINRRVIEAMQRVAENDRARMMLDQLRALKPRADAGELLAFLRQ
eukprot:gnl/Trimastix_PCT/1448.p2 GENE.gnl/Trimastix_PCT/1448~~gnl/Trimastix_PCT/1448.p2  ORF type:complete len:238 (+),score=49.73 gnl/Trimastix_PCT/1448:946-1659(+)